MELCPFKVGALLKCCPIEPCAAVELRLAKLRLPMEMSCIETRYVMKFCENETHS